MLEGTAEPEFSPPQVKRKCVWECVRNWNWRLLGTNPYQLILCMNHTSNHLLTLLFIHYFFNLAMAALSQMYASTEVIWGLSKLHVTGWGARSSSKCCSGPFTEALIWDDCISQKSKLRHSCAEKISPVVGGDTTVENTSLVVGNA